jgi:galactokinase
MTQPFSTSAPGRLCLFGEHQDYLGLPVIAMAINRRCHLHFRPRRDREVRCVSQALGEMASWNLDVREEQKTEGPLRHAMRVLIDEFGSTSGVGWDVEVVSTIPIQAGCSSSTALMTAWIAAWLHILQGGFETSNIVRRCHQYEVLDFTGAGGDMDQFACGHGGLHRFGAGAPQPLRVPEGVFILADSGQPKDTQGHLRRCKDARLPLMADLHRHDIQRTTDEIVLVNGTRTNRDLEAKWGREMLEKSASAEAFGHDLTRHHEVLRDALGLSTARIENILHAALQAGAWGGKINGSGGGGCAFVLAPESQVENIVEAMLGAGATGAWPVQMDQGVACQV